MTSEFSKEPTLASTSITQPVAELAPLLASVRGDVWIPGGTAVIVAPHIAMTACHVVDADWRGHEQRKLPEGNVEASYSTIAIQMLDGGRKAAWWDVRQIWWSNHADIAFLLLCPANQIAEEYKWRQASLNLTLSQVGSRISAFGYRRNSVEITRDKAVHWKTDPATAVGEVQQVISMRGEMTYITNATFENGMSGGPVFNDAGEVIGIVRSTGNGYAQVTAAWCGMDTMIDVPRTGRASGRYPILDLARDGFMKATGWEGVAIQRNESSGIVQMRMRT